MHCLHVCSETQIAIALWCCFWLVGFRVHKGDVRNAFLQGSSDDRTVLCEPVPELRSRLRLEHHECVEMTKSVYGLGEAPRKWWMRIRGDMANLHWEEIQGEPCFWKLRSRKSGKVIALAVAHVDDVLISIRPGCSEGEEAFSQVRGLYEWGTWETDSFLQCGVRVTQNASGEITIDLSEYAEGLRELDIPAHRRRCPDSPAGAAEVTGLKGVLGQLQWLATQGCPRISAELSLLLGYQSVATVDTLYPTYGGGGSGE